MRRQFQDYAPSEAIQPRMSGLVSKNAVRSSQGDAHSVAHRRLEALIRVNCRVAHKSFVAWIAMGIGGQTDIWARKKRMTKT
jgi:hypothetical protein